mgnify:CR=1 FL=1
MCHEEASDWEVIISIIILIVVGFSSMGVLNTMAMATIERMHDFGMLNAVGMKPRLIIATVLAETLSLVALGLSLAGEGARTKGTQGALLEQLLGATGRSRAVPDFPALGVELKTIPVDERGRPRESAFLCAFSLASVDKSQVGAGAGYLWSAISLAAARASQPPSGRLPSASMASNWPPLVDATASATLAVWP